MEKLQAQSCPTDAKGMTYCARSIDVIVPKNVPELPKLFSQFSCIKFHTMAQQITGKLEILDAQNKIRIVLNGDQAGESYFVINNKDGKATLSFGGDRGFMTIGGNGLGGALKILDKDNTELFDFEGKSSGALVLARSVIIGTGKYDGHFEIKDKTDKTTIRLEGELGGLELGREGLGGALSILNEKKNYALLMRSINNKGFLRVGAPSYGGTIQVVGVNGNENIEIDGEGILHLKGQSRLNFYNAQAKESLTIDGKNADIFLGGNGNDGDILIKNKSGVNTIHLDGDAGDIKLLGADCAEDFAIVEATEAGNVMVIEESGLLAPCETAYDKKVAGVLSGAGNYQPGIRLGNSQVQAEKTKPLALIGRVYCLVDADYAPIETGDLLTTSPTKGHAMKATHPDKAFGCILGKALKPLPSGRGLLPILVTLQ
jgi:hypothetical protein